MSLRIYDYDEKNDLYKEISRNGMQTNPIKTSNDGVNGETVEKKLYLRNTDTNLYYTNIQVKATPSEKVRVGDISYPEAFIGFKIVQSDTQPARNEWLSVESGNTAQFSSIGTSEEGDNSYYPFWVQVTIPTGTREQTITDVSISVEAEENPIGV